MSFTRFLLRLSACSHTVQCIIKHRISYISSFYIQLSLAQYEFTRHKNTQQVGSTQKHGIQEIHGIFLSQLRTSYNVSMCSGMYTVYVRAMRMICGSTVMKNVVVSLVFLLQSTLCSQGLAAG